MVSIIDYYNNVMVNQSDPRVNDLFLMQSPFRVIFICVLYFLLVLVVGPKFMQNRKPFNLTHVITIYNFLQVYFSGYIFYKCMVAAWTTKFNLFKCNSVDYSESSGAYEELMVLYLYYLSKYTEFLDTIFFVLRKKNNQVSFLHLYHHVNMPMYVWFLLKFYPGGSFIIVPFLNCFIHVVMYSYYLLAGLGPHLQKYLWWKKYLTVLQLIQFLTGSAHFIAVLFSGDDCNISKLIAGLNFGLGMVFYLLFVSFYKKQYKKPELQKNGEAQITKQGHKNGNIINEIMLNTNNYDKIKSI